MIEILRRLVLAAGVLTAAWMWLESPKVLIGVRRPDFEREYARRYRPGTPPVWGAMERARGILRKSTDPGIAEQYRKQRIASRYIDPPVRDLSSWVREVEAALGGRGASARRAAKGQVFYLPEEPPVDLFVPGIQKWYRGASWLNSYSTVAGRDLEFRFHPEPRKSGAPAWLLYPRRQQARLWILAALALYFLLPRFRPRRKVCYDPIPLLVLDLIAAPVAAFFFALPLAVHESNGAAVESLAGGTGVSWLVAAFVVVGMMTNAGRAAFGITVTESGLRLCRVAGSREIPFGQIAAVLPLVDGPERVGIRLRLTDGKTANLRWAGLMNASVLLEALRRSGRYRAFDNR